MIRLCIPVLALLSPARAQEPLTADALIERAALSEPQSAALAQGDIVAVDVTRLERDQAQLAASLLMHVDAPLGAVSDVLAADATLLHEPGSRFQEIHGPDDPLLLVEYGPDERREAERFLRAEPGPRFNLSADEIRLIRTSRPRRADPILTASELYRRILQTRYRAYREQGLGGVTPYARGSTTTSPAADFATALESFTLLEEFYPDFHAAFRDFPGSALDDATHRFYVRKQHVQGRAVFVLVHWMQQRADDHLLLAQRQYYVGHTYNMAQTIVGCLPYRGGTLVAVLNQAFTEQVVGLFRGVGRSIGRRRIEQSMEPLFARIRDRLER